MNKEQLDIVIQAIDDASSTLKARQQSAESLGDSLESAGNEGSDGMEDLSDGADKAEDDVRKLGDEAQKTGEEVDDLGSKSESAGATMQMAFQNIADGVMRAKEGIVELGRNLMDAMDLAGQQQQQETFLKMSIGAEDTAKQMKVINQLVADLPGDDVAIGGLLSQATAKNAKISADELERMGTNAADYFAAMSNYGKSSVEAQQDLVNYIMQGNTAELERSPVLQAHIDKLKEATTIEERNKALQEALTEEGWAGISTQDTYNNKLETFTAMLDRGKRQMGEMFLDAASGAMDFIGQLDNATGGVLSMGIAIGGIAGGPMLDLVTGVGQVATGLNALKSAGAVTALAEMLPFIVADEEAFLGLALAEDLALWPILAIIAAIVALGVAVYEVGKYFGWWTDVGSMLDAIYAGIMRLWSAFINHPDVQGFIKGVSDAWKAMQPYISAVIKWVMSFFTNTEGKKFDIVRMWIDNIGKAWKAMTTPIRLVISVLKILWSAFTTTYQRCKTALNNAMNAFNNFKNNVQNTINRVKSIIQSITNVNISGITSKLTQPFVNAYNQIAKQVDRIKAKASQIASNPLGALGFGFDIEGMLEAQATTGNTTITQDINLNVDLSNVPANIDTQTLIAVLTDPTVLAALTGNNNFQTLDSRAKNRLNLKTARAGGL